MFFPAVMPPLTGRRHGRTSPPPAGPREPEASSVPSGRRRRSHSPLVLVLVEECFEDGAGAGQGRTPGIPDLGDLHAVLLLQSQHEIQEVQGVHLELVPEGDDGIQLFRRAVDHAAKSPVDGAGEVYDVHGMCPLMTKVCPDPSERSSRTGYGASGRGIGGPGGPGRGPDGSGQSPESRHGGHRWPSCRGPAPRGPL